MISFQEVSKVYRNAVREVRALDNVSLEIGAGEFVAVRGHSGCGKSTMLALAGGLALPSSGRVEVAGSVISSLSASQRAKFRADNIGFVFQLFHLLPYLNVLDNVLVAASEGDRQAARGKAMQLLEKFGLADRLTHRPAELSAGERQRVAMARALLNHPRLLLADEPTGNLDPKNAAAVLDLLAEFHRDGGAVLLVTHDEKASDYAQRTIELAQGRLVERDSQVAAS
ncbi:MAG: ABC transporter ATP-binding protein [Pirellulaceae bacterium]